MSAEFILSFEDTNWYVAHLDEIRRNITCLDTFSSFSEGREFRLTGTEIRSPTAWDYDVRLFLEKDHIFLEVTAHPESIQSDLSLLFEWIRSSTRMSVVDEDGEPSNW